MDLNTAILLGLLEKTVEDIPPADLTNRAGQSINVAYGPNTIAYKVITTFYGNDLATDMRPQQGDQIVSFGLILQAPNNDVVVAIRGTDGIWEWIHDAEFLTVPCPFPGGAGQTEDGFTALYKSLRIAVDPASTTVTNALKTPPPTLNFQQPIGSVTIIGHSLGGALATLLALDVASNTNFKDPIVFTYASPRTGDAQFANTYDQVVPNTSRITNRLDIVPKVPFQPPYVHVSGLYELTPTITFTPLPKPSVKFDLGCEHHITTYLYLLSLKGGGPVLPLASQCAP
jgi:hypothetical protein